MDELIYDRTQSDVEYALSHQDSEDFLKGAYNYTDLNRIETWCEYLATQLNSFNYSATITTKTDWSMSDFPTKAELLRIKNNVSILKNIFQLASTIPENMEKMTYQKANQIEKAIHDMDLSLSGMIELFNYSGEFFSGEV